MTESITVPDPRTYEAGTGWLVVGWRIFREWPIVPGALVALLIIAAVAAPWISPHDPLRGDLFKSGLPPVWDERGDSSHLLGTDIQGRDVLSRVIYGARISLIVAAVVLTTGGIVGTIVGIVAGYYGGQVDEVLMRIVDFTLAVPFLLIALVVVIVFEQSLTVLMTLLAIFSWGGFARQLPGRRHPAADGRVGPDGGAGEVIHQRRVVDYILPRDGDIPDGLRDEFPGGLAARPVRSPSEAALGACLKTTPEPEILVSQFPSVPAMTTITSILRRPEPISTPSFRRRPEPRGVAGLPSDVCEKDQRE